MKRIFFVSLLLMAGKNFAQSLNDKAFKNVIEIECSRDLGLPQGVACRDFYDYTRPTPQTHMLVDVAIPPSVATPVVSILPEISTEKLTKLFPEFQRIIFITPNHNLNPQKEGKKDEPPVSSIVYEQHRANQLKTNKRVIEEGYPDMDYNETDWSKHQEKGHIKVYYAENFDANLKDIHGNSLQQIVKDFEKKIGKKIHYYQKNTDKKGKKTIYYTLDGLSKKEKLEFLVSRKMADFSASPNAKNKDFPIQIFTPYWVKWDK